MDLTYIAFTKHLEGLDVPQIIDALQAMGVQGADLCVRDGYPVNPANVATALPEAVRRFADAGLCIPLVTAPGDFNRPDLDYAERYYAALGAAGVAHVKLGYWHWEPDVPYWTQLDERWPGFMQGFQALSEKYGVKTAIHNHSGASDGPQCLRGHEYRQGLRPATRGRLRRPRALVAVRRADCYGPRHRALALVSARV